MPNERHDGNIETATGITVAVALVILAAIRAVYLYLANPTR